MDTNGRQIQQGDVLLRGVSSIPKMAKKKADTVVAYGEVTFHKHEVLGEGVAVYEDEQGTLYVSAPHGGSIVHEEHKAITLPPGNFKIGIVKEFDHFKEEAKNVAD